VSEIVDPTPIAEERIAAELGTLRDELANATDPKQRKRIERAIRRREEQIRREVVGSPAQW
jgi:transcription elongation GreA/GreB family factor